jgi:hypothetical protein
MRMVRSRLWLLPAIGLLVFAGLGAMQLTVWWLAGAMSSGVPPVPRPREERDPCPSELVLSGEPRQARTDVRVTVQVTNRSERPMRWDRECAAFLRWTVAAEGKEDCLQSRTVPNNAVGGDGGGGPRMLRLAPAEQYCKAVNLTRGFRTYSLSALGNPSNPRVYSLQARDDWKRFEIPSNARRLVVQVEHGSVPSWAFYGMFQPQPDYVDLWYGRAESNELRIDLE